MRKALISVKLLYFAWFGGTACLLPYLTVHMRQLGISLWEAAVINGILSLIQLLGFPLAKVLVHKTGGYKKASLLALTLTAASATSLLLTPANPSTHREMVSLHLQCGPSLEPQMIVNKCWQHCDSFNYEDGMDVRFTECHLDCPDHREGRSMNTADLCFDDDTGRVCHVVEVNNSLSENFTFGVYLGRPREQGMLCMYHVDAVTWHHRIFHQVTCPIILREFDNTNCSLKCLFQEVPRSNDSQLIMTGEKDCRQSTWDERVTFGIYLAIRSFFQIMLGAAFSLMDVAILAVVETEQGRYTYQRVWSLFSTAILAPVAGLTVDMRSVEEANIDYNSVFYLFDGLVGLTFLMVSTMDLQGLSPPSTTDVMKKAPLLLRLPEVVVFLVIIFCLGLVWGFIESFLFWYLLDLNSPHYVLGLTLTVGALLGLPFITGCKRIVQCIGHANILSFSLIIYCIRCIGYFVIPIYWWCLLLEGLEAVTYHVMWAAASRYLSVLIPRSLQATVQAVMGTLHYGLGRGIGSLVGGTIMFFYGDRTAFLVLGITSGIVGIAYLSTYHLVLLKYRDYHEKQKKILEKELLPKTGANEAPPGGALSEEEAAETHKDEPADSLDTREETIAHADGAEIPLEQDCQSKQPL